MYILSICHAAEDGVPLGLMNIHGVYHSLNAAIRAAINADIDLEGAVIEKENGVQASVNDWIAVRIAGGDLGGKPQKDTAPPAGRCLKHR
ncbi:MAG TPA: hypothetical protein VIY49_23625 [Bryobacteraceae bacterium]